MLLHIHLIVNFIVGTILLNVLPITTNEFYQFIIGGLVFDIDHFFWFLYSLKDRNLKDLLGFMIHNYKNQVPKFYIFHTFGFCLIFLIFSLIKPQYLFLFLGYLLHMVCDGIRYIRHYNSWSWLKHWSAIWHIRRCMNQ